MELKSLFLGFIFSIGVFALKNGAGLYYFLSPKRALKAKLLVLFIYATLYLALFGASAWLLREMDLLQHSDILQKILQSGMVIHILMSGVLIAWGILLLRKRDTAGNRSRGWLALVIPCPVCMTVVFFSIAFLLSYFPDAAFKALMGGYLVFMGLSFVSILGLSFWNRYAQPHPDSILGSAMLIVGVYFFLSVALMPHFSELGAIYRLTAYQERQGDKNMAHIVLLTSAALTSFAAGFLFMRRRVKEQTQCR